MLAFNVILTYVIIPSFQGKGRLLQSTGYHRLGAAPTDEIAQTSMTGYAKVYHSPAGILVTLYANLDF